MTPQITQADRIRIRTLFYDAHFTKKQITQQTGFSVDQIRNAIRKEHAAARSGRPCSMSPAQKDELVAFVTGSMEGRMMSYHALSQTLFDAQFGEYTIRSALRSLGYKREPLVPRSRRTMAHTQANPPAAKTQAKKKPAAVAAAAAAAAATTATSGEASTPALMEATPAATEAEIPLLTGEANTTALM